MLRLAERIHDADVEDDKVHRVEGFGVEQIFKGWSKPGLTDQEILSKGFECFDAQFKKVMKPLVVSGNVDDPRPEGTPHPNFGEAFRFWLKPGFNSFGGPTGQIAIMHAELGKKKKWISEARFLHALNYCMLLP
ncbi:MAG TPA: chromate transporter [Chthoniobacterales bacterium]|nr:chromate transporter [Chthoniobacterales bacterium]